jgi:ribosome biogenesis GTPase / thiamine phosphate phosphatase
MQLKYLGWDDTFPQPSQAGLLGRIAQAQREHFLVWTEVGELSASLSGHLRHNDSLWPCVGDWVVVREGAAIVEVIPRRTLLARKKPGKPACAQALAANIDVVFAVSGLDRDYNPRRLERYLTLIYESGAAPAIILNKADLSSDVPAMVTQTQRVAPGVPILALSALEGWGLQDLAAYVAPGQTAALIGSSGAGKSTILNRLLGEARQQTGSVREADQRGRHITTRRELFLTPEGWLLLDLPGLRELQLWADPEQIDQTFADIAELAGRCRFRDCTHTTEPGCAVSAANLDPGRLASFHKLGREVAYLERQTDGLLARQNKQRWKAVHKAMRHNPKSG